MSTTSFVHCLGNALANQHPSLLAQVPSDPNQIDLRFFSRIALGDTFDGSPNPIDGLSYRAILYGNQIVWETSRTYHMGSCEMSIENGAGGDKEFYRIMYNVSCGFKALLQEVRKQCASGIFGEVKESICLPHSDILFAHPQFQQLSKDCGLILAESQIKSYFHVRVSKSLEDETV